MTNNSATTDSVNISEAAKAVQMSNPPAGMPAPIPAWKMAYQPEVMRQPVQVNRAFFDFAEELRKDGSMSDADQNQAKKNYLANDEIHQNMLAQHDFSSKFKNELSEYNEILQNYYLESLNENNAITNEEIYQKIVHDPEGSKEVLQSMQKRMENDPRVLELMEILGVSFDA